MQRTWRMAPAGLLALALASLMAPSARTADAPLAGNWKLVDLSGGNEVTLILFQIENKEGKPQAKVLAAPLLGDDVKLDDVRVDAKSMHFSFKVRGNPVVVDAYAAKGDDNNKILRGGLEFGARTRLVQLEKTDAEKLERAEAIKQTDEAKSLFKAQRTADAKEKAAAFKEILDKAGDKPVAYYAAQELLDLQAKEGAKDDDLKATAEKVFKIGASFGPKVEKNTNLEIAQTLARADKVSPLAVEYARKAEMGLDKTDPMARSEKVLKTLVAALRGAGKADEAKAYDAALAKMGEQLDAEFLKDAVPFKPGEYKGRKGKGNRVAVVELFTGAQCPPCVSADVAFDGALQTYKPADVVLLQYHLHIPGPDPLTNADSEARAKYYGDDLGGTPTAFLSGKVTTPLGGGKADSEKRYDTLRKAIDEALEADAGADLKLTAKRKGDRIDLDAEYADVKKTGEKVKLRFAVVEDVARYPGSNGQRLHHHVVRGYIGGVDGFEVKKAKGEQSVTFTVDEIRKKLSEYLVETNRKRSFLDVDRPLELKHLKVVAFIQDDDNKEILQAVQVDIPDGK